MLYLHHLSAMGLQGNTLGDMTEGHRGVGGGVVSAPKGPPALQF